MLALSMLAAPPATHGQPAGKVWRLGVLSGGLAGAPPLEAFRQGLRELGWVEGQNLVVEYRLAEGRTERLPALARELVQLKVDVIAAGPTPPALAAKSATTSIPIVMLGAFTPVELGLVKSLARPGGNVTGSSWSVDAALMGKGLQLLKETVPNLGLVATLSNPTNPAHAASLENVKLAAQSLGVRLHLMEARAPNELDGVFREMATRRATAVLIVADGLFVSHGKKLADLEATYRLPSMHTLSANVEAGSLMSYGPDIVAVWRRTTVLVDKILRGANPADLPIEQPTTYELVINLSRARALGLTIPPALRQAADRLIE
jgi:putative ABC transport system substrate-binding protein